MTPKQKAKELIDDYHNALMDSIDDEFIRELVSIQCALKAVDEILNNDNNLFNTYSQNDYWQQVKTELENL